MWVDARLDYPDDGAPVRVALIDEVENVIIASEVKAALIQAAKWLAEAGYEAARCHASGVEHVLEPIPADAHADFVPTSIAVGRGFARPGTHEALGW
jgi:hypothetical protein